MLKLRRMAGRYYTLDNKYCISKEGDFWYAFDVKTGQSVVDCENRLWAIKESLETALKERKGE